MQNGKYKRKAKRETQNASAKCTQNETRNAKRKREVQSTRRCPSRLPTPTPLCTLRLRFAFHDDATRVFCFSCVKKRRQPIVSYSSLLSQNEKFQCSIAIHSLHSFCFCFETIFVSPDFIPMCLTRNVNCARPFT